MRQKTELADTKKRKSVTPKEKDGKNTNYCYILKCSDNTYYTGWTNNLEKRIQAHQQGAGAKYTRGRTPVELVYYEVFATKEEAMRREYAIKHLSRKEKEQMIVAASV